MRASARLLLPLLGALALFAVYSFFQSHLWLADRYGLDTARVERVLIFLVVVPLILFTVRALELIAFDFFVFRRKHVRTPVLLREIFSIALYAVLFTWAFSAIFGSKVTAVLATGTVVAAVLGLALQDTLGNLFAGIALHLENGFEVGDVIRAGDYYGVVEAVRWRGTRIRTFENSLVILPNATLARERVEVFPRNNLNGRLLRVGVDYNVPPVTVIDVLTQAAGNVDGVAREVPVLARVAEFGDSSVTYEVKYFTLDYSQRDNIDASIRKAIWYALRRNGIPIPFPIRQLQRYQAPDLRHHPALEEIVDRLGRIDFFSPLSPHDLRALAAAAGIHVWSAGETIIRREDTGDSMFIVHEGNVTVRVGEADVARLEAGEMFGEMALLTGEARTADVVAMTEVVTVEIAKHALGPILQQHPELADAISARVSARRGRLDNLGRAPTEERETILSRIRSYFGL